MEREANKLEEKLQSPDYNGAASLSQLKKRHGFETEKIEQLARHFPNRFEIEAVQNPKGGPSSLQVSLVG